MFKIDIKKMLDDLLENPAVCVGCGYCCLSAICPNGEMNPDNGGCKYLLFDERYWCSNEKAMEEMKGTGCCCSFMNTWRTIGHIEFRGWVR